MVCGRDLTPSSCAGARSAASRSPPEKTTGASIATSSPASRSPPENTTGAVIATASPFSTMSALLSPLPLPLPSSASPSPLAAESPPSPPAGPVTTGAVMSTACLRRFFGSPNTPMYCASVRNALESSSSLISTLAITIGAYRRTWNCPLSKPFTATAANGGVSTVIRPNTSPIGVSATTAPTTIPTTATFDAGPSSFINSPSSTQYSRSLSPTLVSAVDVQRFNKLALRAN
mmetsp:Transcript_15602/g.42017  ORF Transcript_15602/g.42017 Transcript_15602/m.42017 type:complete len:232 (-) Transcript_15602:20-715(-)